MVNQLVLSDKYRELTYVSDSQDSLDKALGNGTIRDLSIDGNHLIVGYSGSAKILRYYPNSKTWSLESTVTPSETDERFGESVDISGDHAKIGGGHSLYWYERVPNHKKWNFLTSYRFQSFGKKGTASIADIKAFTAFGSGGTLFITPICTTSHGLETNDTIMFKTEGTLPEGLDEAKTYIVQEASGAGAGSFVLGLADNGGGGNYITFTNEGTGTHYFTEVVFKSSVALSEGVTQHTFTSVTGISLGDKMTGVGIQDGTTVTSIDGDTITFSKAISGLTPESSGGFLPTNITFSSGFTSGFCTECAPGISKVAIDGDFSMASTRPPDSDSTENGSVYYFERSHQVRANREWSLDPFKIKGTTPTFGSSIDIRGDISSISDDTGNATTETLRIGHRNHQHFTWRKIETDSTNAAFGRSCITEDFAFIHTSNTIHGHYLHSPGEYPNTNGASQIKNTLKITLGTGTFNNVIDADTNLVVRDSNNNVWYIPSSTLLQPEGPVYRSKETFTNLGLILSTNGNHIMASSDTQTKVRFFMAE